MLVIETCSKANTFLLKNEKKWGLAVFLILNYDPAIFIWSIYIIAGSSGVQLLLALIFQSKKRLQTVKITHMSVVYTDCYHNSNFGLQAILT